MAKVDLTADRLRELFDYDQQTGVFVRKRSIKGGFRVGDIAGTNNGRGYIVISVDGKKYVAHRLAWLYVHGEWPKQRIDHINGEPQDNRLANLRDVSQQVNLQNVRRATSRSLSGMLGAHWDGRRGLWSARIRADGRTVFLGRFNTPDAAQKAYLLAKRRLHDGCTI